MRRMVWPSSALLCVLAGISFLSACQGPPAPLHGLSQDMKNRMESLNNKLQGLSDLLERLEKAPRPEAPSPHVGIPHLDAWSKSIDVVPASTPRPGDSTISVVDLKPRLLSECTEVAGAVADARNRLAAERCAEAEKQRLDHALAWKKAVIDRARSAIWAAKSPTDLKPVREYISKSYFEAPAFFEVEIRTCPEEVKALVYVTRGREGVVETPTHKPSYEFAFGPYGDQTTVTLTLEKATYNFRVEKPGWSSERPYITVNGFLLPKGKVKVLEFQCRRTGVTPATVGPTPPRP